VLRVLRGSNSFYLIRSSVAADIPDGYIEMSVENFLLEYAKSHGVVVNA